MLHNAPTFLHFTTSRFPAALIFRPFNRCRLSLPSG